LETIYFNHRSTVVHGWWEQRRFIGGWWQIYAGDPKWVPPYYPALQRALQPASNNHLARMSSLLVYTEALPRRLRPSDSSLDAPLLERIVAAAVVLTDPRRRRDGAAYLALLHFVNDADTLGRLLETIAELVRGKGNRRLIGPTGLSPYLETGLLQDYWNEIPPLHTSYNPPYLPKIADTVLFPWARSQLYQLEIPPELPPAPPARARLVPLEPARLCTDLLPLMVAACPVWGGFAPPDTEEVDFLVNWVSRWPLFGWLAEVDGQPVGFILLQPDLAPRLQRAKGGRNLLWRMWLAWSSRQPTGYGRVLFAGVLPDWQSQGIGRQLLYQGLLTGQQQGWQHLSIGPIPSAAPANKFLTRHGAQPRQTYLLYQREL
jgi:GNAT superfamily N-acetyltransferase